MNRSLLKIILMTAAVALGLAAVVAGWHVKHTLELNASGICIKEGRVLSLEELRSRVIKNFWLELLEANRIGTEEDQIYRSGITTYLIYSDELLTFERVLQLADASANNGKSPPDNFHFDERTVTQADVNELLKREDYSIVIYSPIHGTMSVILPRDMKIKRLNEETPASFYDKYYGINIYRLEYERLSFDIACCDLGDWKMGVSKKEWLEKLKTREIARLYRRTNKFSNCGEILPDAWVSSVRIK